MKRNKKKGSFKYNKPSLHRLGTIQEVTKASTAGSYSDTQGRHRPKP